MAFGLLRCRWMRKEGVWRRGRWMLWDEAELEVGLRFAEATEGTGAVEAVVETAVRVVVGMGMSMVEGRWVEEMKKGAMAEVGWAGWAACR
jgi:hypothetical protein